MQNGTVQSISLIEETKINFLLFKKLKNKNFIIPNKINWEKFKQTNTWNNILTFTKWVEDSCGRCNSKVFIEAQFYLEESTNKINSNYLNSKQAIIKYHNYVKMINTSTDVVVIDNGIKNSIKFIRKYCSQNDITFEQYINDNADIYPTSMIHLDAGSITKHFLALVPNIKNTLIYSYPRDVVLDMFTSEELKDFRLIIETSQTSGKYGIALSDNFLSKINNYIKYGKENR